MKSRESSEVTYRGIGVMGLLGVVFITLKLCHVITWSWVWVLAPFWMPLALVVVIMCLALLIAFIKDKKLEKEIKEIKDAWE